MSSIYHFSLLLSGLSVYNLNPSFLHLISKVRLFSAFLFSISRTLTFLYLPAYNFWLLLCPSSLSYDWQMGSLPLIRTFKDFRAFLVLPTFYSALLFLPILQYFRSKRSIVSKIKWDLRAGFQTLFPSKTLVKRHLC